MDLGDPNSNRCRLIGDYIIGPKIGSGSFAVVWRARHRRLGLEVAIKEIDKKHLSHKIKDNLLKEITILNNITHPNIMRFHEAIQTEDKIYLVLEYCNGGDLSTYIHRHGRISETLANNFMTQLASGLQVLRQNNLIHRDLKPQNLLLSTTNDTQVLKIGDFGFARYLTPQGLADTLCGSPLYMAPEIIQNQKYDAKADLWSVGAILFQLVTGKPPFEGNSQFQLFQNILTSKELRFPEGVLEQLHPDCVDLCRSLLRLNPVERLTFEEFFNHKFMRKPQLMMMDLEQSSLLPENKPMVEQLECFTDDKLPFASDKGPLLHSECLINSSNTNPKKVLPIKEQYSRPLSSDVTESRCEFMLNIASDRQRKSVDAGPSNSSDIWSTKTESVERQLFNTSGTKVGDSLEFVEQEYVLVNAHFGSLETLSSSLEASMQESSATRLSKLSPTKTGKGIVVAMQTGELAGSYVCGVESLGSHVLAPSQASIESGDACGPSPLHPSTRLRLLNQYAHALSELAQEKLNAGLHLESFSVELVVLAVWREALRVCRSWETSFSHNECTLDVGSTNLPQNLKESLDFDRPASVSSFMKHEFITAFDRAEKISNYFHNKNGGAEMPDAMEIIFQTAIGAGRSGAADELIGNTRSAEASYAKARILFSFIVGEATSLPLNPPFSLTDFDQKRIQKYIINLKVHQAHSQQPPSPNQNLGFPRK